MDSTDSSDLESYLEQFPNGIFRSLAQNRLRALETTTPAHTAPAAAPAQPEAAYEGQASDVRCWQELASHLDWYIWDYSYVAGTPVSWSGVCVDGRASGTGTVRWCEPPGI